MGVDTLCDPKVAADAVVDICRAGAAGAATGVDAATAAAAARATAAAMVGAALALG